MLIDGRPHRSIWREPETGRVTIIDQTRLPHRFETRTLEDLERIRKSLGLDDPIAVRYFKWLGSILTLDFGESFLTHEPVTTYIGRHIWPTASVGIISLVLAFLLSIPIGIYSAVREGGIFDRA